MSDTVQGTLVPALWTGNDKLLSPGQLQGDAEPCPGTCFPAPYFLGDLPPALEPYVGTSTTFRFFGSVGCGTVEGCVFSPDSWELTTCVTPTVTQSWGRLKTIYR